MSRLFNYSASEVKDFLETKVFAVFSAFFCLSFVMISQFAKWTETELYPVHNSKYLFSSFESEFLFALKPIFYSLLKVFFLFSEWLPVEPMSLSRFVFALNGLALLSFLYLYLEKKTNRYNAVLAVLILTSAYIFLNRGFRVRSDLLSSSLSFFILWMNLNRKSAKKPAVLLFLSLSLLFITPKAVYWALLIFLLLENQTRQILFKKAGLETALIFILFLMGVSLLFQDPFFIKSLFETVKFYLLSIKVFYTPLLEKGLIETLPHIFISHFIERNFFFIFLIILKLFSIIWQLIEKKSIARQNLYSLILFGLAFLHPDPKLVFFSALSPFFIIAFFTDSIWLKLINKLYSEKFKVILLGWLFLYGFSYISYFSYRTVTQKNNLTQKKMIKRLNDFYKDTPSEWSILDPACLIYSRKTNCKYLLYQERLDQTEYIKKNDFDIILSSYYLSLFHLLTENKSNIQYVSVKNHILYKALVIDKDSYKDLKQESSKTESANINSNEKLEQSANSKQNISLEQDKNSNKNKNSEQKTAPDENPNDTQEILFLSGDKLFHELLKTLGRDSLQGAYFYTYIDSWNRSVDEELVSKKSALLPFKSYSEKELRESLIPVKESKIALFYLPFPLDLKEDSSLRVLLKYDRW